MLSETRYSVVIDDETRQGLKDGIVRIMREELEKLRNEMRTMVSTDNNGALVRKGQQNMPKFAGTNIKGWLDECERFFRVNNVLDEHTVSLISNHLFDIALIWHQKFVSIMGENVTWMIYKNAILRRFGSLIDDPNWHFSSNVVKDSSFNQLEEFLVNHSHIVGKNIGAQKMFDEMPIKKNLEQEVVAQSSEIEKVDSWLMGVEEHYVVESGTRNIRACVTRENDFESVDKSLEMDDENCIEPVMLELVNLEIGKIESVSNLPNKERSVVVNSVQVLFDDGKAFVKYKLELSIVKPQAFNKNEYSKFVKNVMKEVWLQIPLFMFGKQVFDPGGKQVIGDFRKYNVRLTRVKAKFLLELNECSLCIDICSLGQEYAHTAKTKGGYIFESKEVFDPVGKLVCDLRGSSGKNAYDKQELEANGKSQIVASVISYILGKDLETKNGNSGAGLESTKSMFENVKGSVKRIRGDKEDFILESQDKKVDNDVKEIRKRSCLSNLIFGDDDMNLSSHQNGNSDYVVMGVNEFVGGANGSDGNLVSRSNSRFLAYKYGRNIFEVEYKRGIGSDACKFAIRILNCSDQGGLISGQICTLVGFESSKGQGSMQTTCVTLDVSDVDWTTIRWKGDKLVSYFEGTSNTSTQPNTPYVCSSYDHNCATTQTKKKRTCVRFVIWKWSARNKYIEEGAVDSWYCKDHT